MISVGVAGLRRGLSLLNTFAMYPGVEVVAVCDTDTAALERIGKEKGIAHLYQEYEDLVRHDLDCIVIGTPMPMHAAQAIAALEAGRHVFSEVPAVASLAEAEALVRAARKARGKYMLAENCCYWAFIESWRKSVSEGAIGKVVYAEAEYIHDCRSLMRDAAGNPTWRTRLPPIQYCTHSLGPLLLITGDRCLTATGMHPGSNVAPDLGVIDMEVGLFKGESGAVYKILCGFSVVREPSFHYYTLYGTHGCLERARGEDKTLAYFDSVPHLRGMISYPLSTNHTRAPSGATVGGHGTCEYFMVADLLEAIREDRNPSIDIDFAMDMTLPGICAHLSAQQDGQPVPVPNSRDWV